MEGSRFPGDSDSEKAPLLTTTPTHQIPKDSFHLAYIIYFTLGAGYLLPWHAFITAVDYFSYLYPEASVNRTFAVVNMVICLVCVALTVLYAHKSSSMVRINAGLVLFVVSLLVVPMMDVFYIKGEVGFYTGYYVTVGAVALCGVAGGLVQGGVVGAAGELPERYMQATMGGTAASDRLPVLKYYKEIKTVAVNEHKSEKDSPTDSVWRSILCDIAGRVKWFGFGIVLIYTVTLSIFPGSITEDVHSQALKDWFPIMLITCYDVIDQIGKCLPALYLLENTNVAVGACVGRFLFYPLFFACTHGPKFLRSEIPVTILTGLLGLTNGYLTSVLMILAPKALPVQHSETAGIVMVLFLITGLAIGSVVSMFWAI